MPGQVRRFTARPQQQGQQRSFTTQQARDPWDFLGNFGRDVSAFGNNVYQGIQNSPLGQIGGVIGGLANRFGQDATGQGVPERIPQEHIRELNDRLATANLTGDQRRQIQMGIQSGRYNSAEDALNEISTLASQNDRTLQTNNALSELGGYQQNALHNYEMGQVNDLGDIRNFENQFLGDNSYLTQTENRLNPLTTDPQALRSDRDYRGIFADILNQTVAGENQATREASQRAAGRGVSGAGGAALATSMGARQAGDLARAEGFRQSQLDVLRRLGELNNTRTNLQGQVNQNRQQTQRYYGNAINDVGRWGTEYGNSLRNGLISTPYDYASQAENRIGANTYNAGLQRDALGTILNTGLSAAGIGTNLAGTAMNSFKIPGLK